jgi:actin-like protein 6A
MYCGDETGSFIGDIGSHTARFGYGGDDAPKYVVPAYVHYPNQNDDPANVATALEKESRHHQPNKRKHKYSDASTTSWSIPTSSYSSRYETGDMKSALRLATHAEGSWNEPIVDPDAFLSQGGTVENWDAYEHLWQSALQTLHVWDRHKHTRGGTVPRSASSGMTRASLSSSGAVEDNNHKCIHPLLAVSPGYTHHHLDSSSSTSTETGKEYQAAVHRQQMTRMTELLLEQFDAPAAFVAPTPMLAAFCHGRSTALLVDVGASGCRVTPVVDGLLLRQAQRRNGRGGDWLGHVTWQALLQQEKEQSSSSRKRPWYLQGSLASSPLQRGVYNQWALQDLMYELRMSELVSLEPLVPAQGTYDHLFAGSASTESEAAAAQPWTLPDGTPVHLSSDLCHVPELLFVNHLPFQSSTRSNNSTPLPATCSSASLQHLIHAALSAVGDADIRKDLAAQIVLVGGASRIPLSYASSTTGVESNKGVKVIASRQGVERSCAAWIGASILTSLGSFQQLWLSKAEYEEYGAALAVQRFP